MTCQRKPSLRDLRIRKGLLSRTVITVLAVTALRPPEHRGAPLFPQAAQQPPHTDLPSNYWQSLPPDHQNAWVLFWALPVTHRIPLPLPNLLVPQCHEGEQMTSDTPSSSPVLGSLERCAQLDRCRLYLSPSLLHGRGTICWSRRWEGLVREGRRKVPKRRAAPRSCQEHLLKPQIMQNAFLNFFLFNASLSMLITHVCLEYGVFLFLVKDFWVIVLSLFSSPFLLQERKWWQLDTS